MIQVLISDFLNFYEWNLCFVIPVSAVVLYINYAENLVMYTLYVYFLFCKLYRSKSILRSNAECYLTYQYGQTHSWRRFNLSSVSSDILWYQFHVRARSPSSEQLSFYNDTTYSVPFMMLRLNLTVYVSCILYLPVCPVAVVYTGTTLCLPLYFSINNCISLKKYW